MLYPRLIYATILGVFYGVLGILLLLKDPHSRLNRSFALFEFSVAIWGMAAYALFIENNATGLLVYRCLYLAGPVAIVALITFIQHLLGNYDAPSSIFWRKVVIGFAVLSIPFHFTPLMIRPFRYIAEQEVSFHEIAGPLYPLVQIVMALIILVSAIVTFFHLRSTTGTRRNQLKYVFLAMILGVLAIFFLTLRSMFWRHDHPLTYSSLQMASSFCFAYVIFKYELFEFNAWMRRAAIFGGVYALILGIPFLFVDSWSRALAFIVYGLACTFAPTIGSFLRDKTEERMKKDLISNITHEFKGPLNNMENALDILGSEISKDSIDKAEVREFLTMAEKNAERIRSFVHNLLEAARIEKPDLTLRLEPCDAGALIRETLNAVRPTAHLKKIGLMANVPEKLTIVADAEKLKLIFSNLLSNAVKYTDKGQVVVDAEESNNKVRISVLDTGMGIHPDYLNDVFERFFRTPETKNSSTKGTGLGLSIAKGWTLAMGGKIWAESEGIGKGSKFTVEFSV